MSDLLSAATLLVAVVTILYSLWYAEIKNILAIIPKQRSEDNVRDCAKVKQLFFAKALPLTFMAIMVAVIFTPDAIRILLAALDTFRSHGISSIWLYDAVRTAYCFVFIISLVLAIHATVLTRKAWDLWKLLR